MIHIAIVVAVAQFISALDSIDSISLLSQLLLLLKLHYITNTIINTTIIITIALVDTTISVASVSNRIVFIGDFLANTKKSDELADSLARRTKYALNYEIKFLHARFFTLLSFRCQ